MSLTESEEVHAGLHESGVNDLLTAVLTARPRLLNYRSSPLVPGPPVAATAWTTMAAIPFPGVPGGIDWGVQFDIPKVDFHPDSSGGLPPPLVLGANRFSLRTIVTLTLLSAGPAVVCMTRTTRRKRSLRFGSSLNWSESVTLTPCTSGPLEAAKITFGIDAVEIVDIAPDRLESLLEASFARCSTPLWGTSGCRPDPRHGRSRDGT